MNFLKIVFEQKKYALGGIIFGFALLSASYYLGYTAGSERPKTILIEGVSNTDKNGMTADFSVFWQAWKKLKDNHLYGEEMVAQDLVYGAISGLAASFKDPNTMFFPPEESKKFEEDLRGSFGGIGAEIGMRDDQLVVIAPLEGSPAAAIGLKAGDSILKIDGTITSGFSVADAVKKIRGPLGSIVTLQIWREGFTAPKDFAIKRSTIVVPTVISEMKEDNIAYIRVNTFNQNVPSAFAAAARNALAKKSSGMILDLRNDPGGFLEVAVDLLGWFLKRDDVAVIERLRSGPDQVFRASGTGALQNMPLVVLVNEGSASASEIVAGALRDQRGVKLIGMKTFGKGSVQDLHRLKDDSQLKITIAEWLTPKKTTIEKTGLTPDIEVKISEEDVKTGKDTQLTRAIEVLKEEIAKRNLATGK